MLVVGLGAGAMVTLVARALPERGRLIGRPICAAQGCGLRWLAASQTARALGLARNCPTCGAGPSRGDALLELATAAIVVALSVAWPLGLPLAIHAAFATLLMM